MVSNPLFAKYYDSRMLLDKRIAVDIFQELYGKNKKVLVFGLGYDSKLWYNANGCKDIWFIESEDSYINESDDIDPKYIIKYKYDNINVKMSFDLSIDEIKKRGVPQVAWENTPYDLIIVDGPTGFDDTKPGRLLPIYWSYKYFSRTGTIIYVDDVERELENYSINKFFSGFIFSNLFITKTRGRHTLTGKFIKN